MNTVHNPLPCKLHTQCKQNFISVFFLIVGNADSVLRLAGVQKHVLTDTLEIYSNVFDISHS